MNFTFSHSEANAKGQFDMMADGKIVGQMTYSRIDPNNIIVDHTAVDPQMKGKGLGKHLVMNLVEWARSNNQKVLPLCPFAKGVIERTPEIQDILRK